MTLYETLKADLLTARKERNQTATLVIRMLIGELDNAAAVDVGDRRQMLAIETLSHTSSRANSRPRKELSEAEMRGVLQENADEISAAIKDYERMGATQQSADLRAQLTVINRYLT